MRLDEEIGYWLRHLKSEDRAMFMKYDLASIGDATTVIKRIEDMRALHINKIDALVRDYFNPPEDMITCELCDDQFGMGTAIVDLEHHLKYRHETEWKRISDGVERV